MKTLWLGFLMMAGFSAAAVQVNIQCDAFGRSRRGEFLSNGRIELVPYRYGVDGADKDALYVLKLTGSFTLKVDEFLYESPPTGARFYVFQKSYEGDKAALAKALPKGGAANSSYEVNLTNQNNFILRSKVKWAEGRIVLLSFIYQASSESSGATYRSCTVGEDPASASEALMTPVVPVQ
jgi:hypothetical protein